MKILSIIICMIWLTLPNFVYSEIIFNEGFESGTPETFMSNYYGNLSGHPRYSIQSSIAGSGTYALRFQFTEGQRLNDYVTQHFGDSTKSPVYPTGQGNSYQDVYIQFKLYYPDGFDWSAGNNKQMIIGTEDGMRHDNICCNPWVSHYITLLSGGTGNNGFFNAEGNNKNNPAVAHNWFGLSPNINGYSNSNRYYIQTGSWYTIEIHKTLNDPGQSNGVFEMWIDGEQVAEYTDLLYRVPWDESYGADFIYGTNFILLTTYIADPAPQDQEMYYDDIIISSSYVGTNTHAIAPNPPYNLKIITD